MSRRLLHDRDRRFYDLRAEWSAQSEDRREGLFRLYNKNRSITTFVRPLGQLPNQMTWIVEADEPLDAYFESVLPREP